MAKKMKNSDWDECCEGHTCGRWHCKHTGGAMYGLGFIGAAIYYISTAATFWAGVLGVLKAIVWPAFFVYETFKYLGL